jgi:hypothetical protein
MGKVGASRHVQNGMLLSMLFAFSILSFLVCQTLVSIIYLKNYLLAWQDPIFNALDFLSLAPIFLWAILFLIWMLLAVFDKSFSVPFFTKAFKNKGFRIAALTFVIVLQILTLLIQGITLRANYLTQSHMETASVYLLYENALYMGGNVYGVPEWFFSLGFYPIAEKAASRWGDASIAVEPLSKNALETALKNGRFVFVASHGGYQMGGISLTPDPKDEYFPESINKIGGVGKNLQFVYLAGCNIGNRHDEWTQALSPAKVLMFDRISLISEHIHWLLFDGPKVVMELQ